jgi:hypothetical protein
MSSIQKFLDAIELLKKSNKISDLKEEIKGHDKEVTFFHKVHKMGYKMIIDTRFNGFQAIDVMDDDYCRYSLELLLTII